MRWINNNLCRLSICTLVTLLCTSCRDQSGERREAMAQMKRLVDLLHSNVLLRPGRPGFPQSTYRTEDGEPTCSWRLSILDVSLPGPYVDQSWRSPVNQSQDTNANRELFAVRSRKNPSQFTQVFALVGDGSAFTEYAVGNGRDTSDAEPDAILLLECKNDLIHWMEPGDIHIKALLRSSRSTGIDNLKPNYPDGFLVAFVDGAVWHIRADVPWDAISPFYTLEGARTHDRDKELGPYVIDKLAPLNKHDGRYLFEP